MSKSVKGFFTRRGSSLRMAFSSQQEPGSPTLSEPGTSGPGTSRFSSSPRGPQQSPVANSPRVRRASFLGLPIFRGAAQPPDGEPSNAEPPPLSPHFSESFNSQGSFRFSASPRDPVQSPVADSPRVRRASFLGLPIFHDERPPSAEPPTPNDARAGAGGWQRHWPSFRVLGSVRDSSSLTEDPPSSESTPGSPQEKFLRDRFLPQPTAGPSQSGEGEGSSEAALPPESPQGEQPSPPPPSGVPSGARARRTSFSPFWLGASDDADIGPASPASAAPAPPAGFLESRSPPEATSPSRGEGSPGEGSEGLDQRPPGPDEAQDTLPDHPPGTLSPQAPAAGPSAVQGEPSEKGLAEEELSDDVRAGSPLEGSSGAQSVLELPPSRLHDAATAAPAVDAGGVLSPDLHPTAPAGPTAAAAGGPVVDPADALIGIQLDPTGSQPTEAEQQSAGSAGQPQEEDIPPLVLPEPAPAAAPALGAVLSQFTRQRRTSDTAGAAGSRHGIAQLSVPARSAQPKADISGDGSPAPALGSVLSQFSRQRRPSSAAGEAHAQSRVETPVADSPEPAPGLGSLLEKFSRRVPPPDADAGDHRSGADQPPVPPTDPAKPPPADHAGESAASSSTESAAAEPASSSSGEPRPEAAVDKGRTTLEEAVASTMGSISRRISPELSKSGSAVGEGSLGRSPPTIGGSGLPRHGSLPVPKSGSGSGDKAGPSVQPWKAPKPTGKGPSADLPPDPKFSAYAKGTKRPK